MPEAAVARRCVSSPSADEGGKTESPGRRSPGGRVLLRRVLQESRHVPVLGLCPWSIVPSSRRSLYETKTDSRLTDGAFVPLSRVSSTRNGSYITFFQGVYP